MKKLTFALVAAALVAGPAVASAQGFGAAARAGTLGIGAEVAIGLGESAAIRGGLGLVPFELNATIDETAVTLELPDTWYNVGLDLYLNGSFRLGGGFLFKPDDPSLTGDFTTPQEIGDRTFTPEELGTLTGVVDSKDSAPYVLIGFGKHTASGIGLSLDVGLAFLGDPDVTLDAQGGAFSDQAQLQEALDQEARNYEDDMRTYLRYWPILNLGLRIGVG
jgi:hypothetical protein